MDANQVAISHDAFDALLDASSLGAPRVQALRRLTPSAVQEHLASRLARQDAADPGRIERVEPPAELDVDQVQPPTQRHEQEQDLDHERQDDGSRSHNSEQLNSFTVSFVTRIITPIFFLNNSPSGWPDDSAEHFAEAAERIYENVIQEHSVHDAGKAVPVPGNPGNVRFHRKYTFYPSSGFDGTDELGAGLEAVRYSHSGNLYSDLLDTLSRIGAGNRARTDHQRGGGRDARGRRDGTNLLAPGASGLLMRASGADLTPWQSEHLDASQVLYVVAAPRARPRGQETWRPAAAREYLAAVALTCELRRILAGQGSGGWNARRSWLDRLDSHQEPGAAAHPMQGTGWEHLVLRLVLQPPLGWRDRLAAATCRDAVRSAFIDEHQMLKERILAVTRNALLEELYCPADKHHGWNGETSPARFQTDCHVPLSNQELSTFTCKGKPPRLDSDETFTELVAAAQKLLNLFQGDSSTLVLPANKESIEGLQEKATVQAAVRRLSATGKSRQ
ncbi:hypothetical protein EES43_29795 [Streptomyces sp. ADI96-02]|uniref:hypothetical protein n=1 Tax=unclassified Streptomyces TaxID=2593676 RepID=UPI000F550CCC|nr:hypothetical protein [Streptomyces sp. ADI96-02]RPK53995.1 hypothetical protein EES43_29795 [Streptomyces sp. ADI96-02]